MVRRLAPMGLGMILALLLCLGAQAAGLEARVDRNPVAFGQSVRLTLEARGGLDEEPDFSVLEDDFDILGRTKSRNYSFYNGSGSSTRIWTLSLMPRRQAEILIPSLTAGNQSSAPILLKVTPAAAAKPAAEQGAFITTELEPEKVYKNAQSLLRVRLYLQHQLAQGAVLTEPEPPTAEGEIRKLGQDRIFETVLDGVRFDVVERRYALFPFRAGTLEIPPLMFEGRMVEPGRSVFDPFGGQGRISRIFSGPMKIEVQEAKDESPENPWVPAENLRIYESLQPKDGTIALGESLTRTIRIEADGLLPESLPEPGLSYPASLKLYPDRPDAEEKTTADGITAVKTFTTALIPTEAGEIELPGFDYRWWDIRQQRFETIRIPPRMVRVSPAAGAAAPRTAAPAPAPITLQEAPPPSPALEAALPEGEFPPWRLLSLALGTGWLLTALLWAARSRKTAKAMPAKSGGTQEQLAQARQELKKICLQNRGRELIPALLRWGRLQFPYGAPRHLGELRELLSDKAQGELDRLGELIADNQLSRWQGKELWAQIAATPAAGKNREKAGGLPPLYP